VETKKKKNPSSRAARVQVRPTFSLLARERSPGDRLLRERKEEVQMKRTRRTRGQKEGQTGRPERGTRGCHGYRHIPASPRCHGDGGTLSLGSPLSSSLFSFSHSLCSAYRPTLSHSRNSVFLTLERQSSLRRQGATRSLAFASSFFRGGYRCPRREGVEREEQTKKTARKRVRMRDTWSFAISRLDASPERFDHLSLATS